MGHLLDQHGGEHAHRAVDDHHHEHEGHHDHDHDHGSGPLGRLTHLVSELVGGHSHDAADQVDEAL